MSIDADQLTARLKATINTGPSGGWGWLWSVLLRELAHGDPLSVTALAAASGRGVGEVRAGLAALPDTEYDEHGRVVGHGITLRPTPHQFTVEGRRLHTWCALDTLIFPTVLDRPADVVSPTLGTGQLVCFRVDPHAGITQLDPSTAVVSVLVPQCGPGVRSRFCNQGHFYASPDDAQDWATEHPAGTLLPVHEAFELGRRLAYDLLTDQPGR